MKPFKINEFLNWMGKEEWYRDEDGDWSNWNETPQIPTEELINRFCTETGCVRRFVCVEKGADIFMQKETAEKICKGSDKFEYFETVS